VRATRWVAFGLALAALGVTTASAQDAARRSVGVFLLQSMTSGTAADPICQCPGRGDLLAPVSVSAVEIEVTLPLRVADGWGLEIPLRVVPLMLVRNNPVSSAYRNGHGWTMSPDTPRGSTLGAGVRPLALRGGVGSESVRLHAQIAAGVFGFGTPLFASNAKRLNFAYEMGVGVSVAVQRAGRAVLGFRRDHLSNAGLGEVNPGLNSHVAYLGFTVGS
jgi:hypothetical protein